MSNPAAGRTRRPSRGPRPGKRAVPAASTGARPSSPDEPKLPADVDVRRLAPEVRAELSSLAPDNAARVAGHLVAAGDLLEEDPEAALAHARAARRTAGRLAAVREAVGIAAYVSGHWQEALTELRAVRRMTGDAHHLPLMADCERGLGRPERALELAGSPDAGRLDAATSAELRMVQAGARRDLGQLDAALLILQDAGVHTREVRPWTSRLWYAYADLLEAAGRRAEARSWFEAVAAADDDETDAVQRLAE